MVLTVKVELLDMGDGMVYDTDINITWYNNPNNNPMTWDEAVKWAASLTVGGYRDWRLPTTPGIGYGYLHEGEMGRLYYDTLGNDDDGALANKEPFSDLQPYDYWSSTGFRDNPADFDWAFDFRTGRQRSIDKNSIAYAIAVRSGGNNLPRASRMLMATKICRSAPRMAIAANLHTDCFNMIFVSYHVPFVNISRCNL